MRDLGKYAAVNQNCELDLVRRREIARSEMVDGCANDEG